MLWRRRPTARFRESVSAEPLNHYTATTATREAVRRQSNNNWGRKKPGGHHHVREKLGCRAASLGYPVAAADKRRPRRRPADRHAWRERRRHLGGRLAFLSSALPEPEEGDCECSGATGPRLVYADACSADNAKHTAVRGGYICCVINLERRK